MCGFVNRAADRNRGTKPFRQNKVPLCKTFVRNGIGFSNEPGRFISFEKALSQILGAQPYSTVNDTTNIKCSAIVTDNLKVVKR